MTRPINTVKVGNLAPGERIGFYGCANRLVRVGMKNPKKGARLNTVAIEVDCPACNRRHSVRAMWRLRKAVEKVDPEVYV